MRKVLLVVGPVVALLVGVILARTASYRSGQAPADQATVLAIPPGAAERLAGSLRIATISPEDPAAFDGEPFRALHAYLRTAFPRVHSQLACETVRTFSLLCTWAGKDPSLDPILLMGHLDVVPVEAGTGGKWKHEPFGGRIADGFIWGRGSIDNKSAVVGTLEAVEALLGEGFQPRRTVLLAYGHDEEVGGMGGGREIAALLAGRGVDLELVLDEGGVIGDGLLPGVSDPVALVGIAEKGFVSVELSVRTTGGHSSLPPRQGAIGILSAAIARLEDHPMPPRLEGPTRQLFDRVGPRLPFAQRAVFANLWLTNGLVLRNLEGTPATNAMVRTTMAPTIFHSGTKDNVLPSHARAVLNFRILTGDTMEDVVAHVRRVVDDDRVEVRPAGAFSAEPSPVSGTTSDAFRALERTILSLSPDAIVAPYLVAVATDARHYGRLSRNVFRLLPLRITPSDVQRMHGTDERVAVDNYHGAVRFYRQLVVNAAGR